MLVARRMRRQPPAAGGATLSFVDSATSTGATITIPSGASTSGTDIAVLWDFSVNRGSTTPTGVTPTGWTSVGFFNAGTGTYRGHVRISYKVLGSGDPGSSVTGMSDVADHKIMMVFRKTSAIGTPTVGTLDQDSGGTDPTSSSSTVGTAPLIVLGAVGCDNFGSIAFTTESPAFTGTVTEGSSDMIAGYKMYDSSPVDHTVDVGDNGSSNFTACFHIEV